MREISDSLPFHPFIESTLAMLSGNRVKFTVLHRSGDTTNRSGPYCAVLLVHVALLTVKSPSAFDKFRKIPPPFPVAKSPQGAPHDENDVSFTVSPLPPVPPLIVPLSPPPQLSLPFTLLFVKLHNHSPTTTEDNVPTLTLTPPPFPDVTRMSVKFDLLAFSSQPAATVISDPTLTTAELNFDSDISNFPLLTAQNLKLMLSPTGEGTNSQ
jgi:hypothetical protein